jgi:GT2 family glycosyltransferase
VTAALAWPSVTVVALVYNRREELRDSLRHTLASDYPGEIDVIVVDNASTDGSAEMVREEFPEVRVLTHAENVGVSGWNIGFAAATGEWTLVLDDDCYLPPDGLRKAVQGANEYEADLVSFRVSSTRDAEYYFSEEWWAGLFGFWGCAALVRTSVMHELGGYDPEIFLYSHETEFTIRLLDRGYKHLHFPEVVARHMKAPPPQLSYKETDHRPRRFNNHNHGYTVGKLLRRRDALGALVALVVNEWRDGVRFNWRCGMYWHHVVIGFVHGLRHRRPVRPEVSHCFRMNFWAYASPWWLTRPPLELAKALPREIVQGRLTDDDRGRSSRREEYFESRAPYYPEDAPGALTI